MVKRKARAEQVDFLEDFEASDEDVEFSFSGEDESDLDSISSKDISKLQVWPTDWTIGTLLDQLKSGNINLTPVFQRRDAWTDQKKSRFIESLLLRLPVPHIVLAEMEPGTFSVIDGKQRLLAIAKYALEQFVPQPLELKGLQIRKDLNNTSFVDLKNSSDVNTFLNNTIRTIALRNWEKESILYLLFLRLNQNSVSLSPQELRGALHPGPFLRFLDGWTAQTDSLKLIFPRIPDFRMRDIEVVLRFIGFSEFSQDYSGNMKEFLDQTLKKSNKDWKAGELHMRDVLANLDSALTTANSVFHGDEFRKYLPEKARFERRLNRALMDVMLYYFSDSDVRRLTLAKTPQVVDAFKQLCTDNTEFIKSIESTTKSMGATKTRFEVWGACLGNVLGKRLRMPALR